MAYSEKVIEHYENPRNVGGFTADDADVGTGMVGAPACGDVMKLQIKVNPATGLIEDAKFKTYGCGSAIASSSLVTEWVKGKTLDQALAIKNTSIAEELALPPVKIHCSILAEDAIKAAVADYRQRHDAHAGATRLPTPPAPPPEPPRTPTPSRSLPHVRLPIATQRRLVLLDRRHHAAGRALRAARGRHAAERERRGGRARSAP